MRHHQNTCAGILTLAAFASAPLVAQEPAGEAKEAKPYEQPPVYAGVEPLRFTLTADFGQIRRDRKEENPWREARISYTSDTGTVSVPVRLRTRGVWRKANCEIPPLMLNFTKDSVKGTEFRKLDGARLSMHCRDNDAFEQYVLQEYQLYRVHKVLNPLSFDVRLARVAYVDEKDRDTIAHRWAFIQERDQDFVARHGVKLIEIKGASPADLEPSQSAFLGVFQYFVGNSDYSTAGLHNVVLVLKEPHYIGVPRDFDWSGAVNARYAKPNPILKGVRTVRQRIMRGYCTDPGEYEKVFALFREKKEAIYGLYRDSIGAQMKPDVVKETLEYFDEFYEIINDPKKSKREIVEACLRGSA